MDVDLEPPETDLWQALGVPPQPAFRVNMPLRRSRPLPDTRPVLRPLMIKQAGLISITGAVRTPSDAAVPRRASRFRSSVAQRQPTATAPFASTAFPTTRSRSAFGSALGAAKSPASWAATTTARTS
jgi:hypothetical protein